MVVAATIFAFGNFTATKDDSLRRNDTISLTAIDRFGDTLLRVRCQQLQHLNELPRAGNRSVTGFQSLPKIRKFRWQTPVLVDVGMIEVGGLALQRGQIVKWIENHFMLGVASIVPGNQPTVAEYFNAIDIRLHNHWCKRVTTRHAVTNPFPGYRLILINVATITDTRIKHGNG